MSLDVTVLMKSRLGLRCFIDLSECALGRVYWSFLLLNFWEFSLYPISSHHFFITNQFTYNFILCRLYVDTLVD